MIHIHEVNLKMQWK